ncbi:uncharacterized protein TNIN_15321 [Trichonephila inaurata madagascariensis]|uniref:Nose resistant-to-fluoxetine protein N-terminal domain-containing protein n=1 Tax=Trichonephila inaurata madagascariensis TaxID=2747483 RepID=A0A8X6XTP5_9ARAC|nr:uncharacterized protein TNIN_15321 [Trichonephila inaurata madagascariensis]
MDATGKPSGGLMEGTSTALGDYDECLDTVSPSKYPIFGEYCLLEVKPPGSIVQAMKDYQVYKENTNHTIANTKSFLGFLQKVRSNPDHVIFRLGVCVPSSCSTKGIQSMMDRATEEVDISINVAHCDYKKDFHLDSHQTLVITFIVIFAIFVALGTVISIIRNNKETSPVPSSPVLENSSTEISKTKRQICLERMKDLSSISLCQGAEKLFNCDSDGDASDVVGGIKVLTVIFAIFTHTYALPHPLHLYRFLLFGAVANSSVGADSFFFLAGFYFIYNRWRLLKRPNIGSYILKFLSVMFIR